MRGGHHIQALQRFHFGVDETELKMIVPEDESDLQAPGEEMHDQLPQYEERKPTDLLGDERNYEVNEHETLELSSDEEENEDDDDVVVETRPKCGGAGQDCG